jgi:hypothetical protein
LASGWPQATQVVPLIPMPHASHSVAVAIADPSDE